MHTDQFSIKGLTDKEVAISREKNGQNILTFKKKHSLWEAFAEIMLEPMMVLLIVACTIYFISGKTGDGIFFIVAIIIQITISLFQDSRSKNALEKLKELAQPKAKVLRNGVITDVHTNEIVIGDYLFAEEGTSIAADGIIVHSNDFSVNQSILTGESMPVEKSKNSIDNHVYLGTNVVSGLAIARVTAVGNQTELGKIGKGLENIQSEKSPLELQIQSFVKMMAILGIIVFVIVWIINWSLSGDILKSLLQSLTLAMSILPEEIPVAFTTFMAIGAWRLINNGIIVKQMKTVETLGSATVICTDKTGTITENKMELVELYDFGNQHFFRPTKNINPAEQQILTTAMWASEPIPFDPMENALHEAYGLYTPNDHRKEYQLIHEYPLSGTPPLMTHIFQHKKTKELLISAKGAPEAFFKTGCLSEAEQKTVQQAINHLASEGYRVLGVAMASTNGEEFPKMQQEFNFKFLGLVAFVDPPKQNMQNVIADFYNAGLQVKMITGDNTATSTAIAKQIHLKGYENPLTGEQVMHLNETELQELVNSTHLFTRMFPNAKLKIINALKANHEVVAMTGDGVNDGPALKAAHIGIAMGKKGSEIAKQAASLILMEDDLSKMIDAVAMGRKIYSNLKKAIQYIISIHIPIILTVFIPLALGWLYPNIFTPVHVIFLEMVMGPTCSIIYENEPIEKNTMLQKPKSMGKSFFSWKELSTSIIQGLAITAATLFIYRYAVNCKYDEATTRTMVFTVLITANIVLTLVNRSFYYSVFTTLEYKNRMVPGIIAVTIACFALMLFVPSVTQFFELKQPNVSQFILSVLIGTLGVIWFELVKWNKRRKYPIA